LRSRSAWVAPRSVGLAARPEVRVEGFAITPEQLIGSGATVAAIVRYTGTGKATGKPLDVPVVHVWDIRDGKLARFRQFIDTVKFAEVVPAGVAAA
jgi:ketosteroid isomerase-like protein